MKNKSACSLSSPSPWSSHSLSYIFYNELLIVKSSLSYNEKNLFQTPSDSDFIPLTASGTSLNRRSTTVSTAVSTGTETDRVSSNETSTQTTRRARKRPNREVWRVQLVTEFERFRPLIQFVVLTLLAMLVILWMYLWLCQRTCPTTSVPQDRIEMSPHRDDSPSSARSDVETQTYSVLPPVNDRDDLPPPPPLP